MCIWLDVYESVHHDTVMKTTNKMQLCRLVYYSLSALHVSGDVFVHHLVHLTVFTASGSTQQCRLPAGVVDVLELSSNASEPPAGSDIGEYYQML